MPHFSHVFEIKPVRDVNRVRPGFDSRHLHNQRPVSARRRGVGVSSDDVRSAPASIDMVYQRISKTGVDYASRPFHCQASLLCTGAPLILIYLPKIAGVSAENGVLGQYACRTYTSRHIDNILERCYQYIDVVRVGGSNSIRYQDCFDRLFGSLLGMKTKRLQLHAGRMTEFGEREIAPGIRQPLAGVTRVTTRHRHQPQFRESHCR